MSRIPLSFGYFDQNRTNWYATNFIGLMDDFRVYDIALSQTEINQFHGMVPEMCSCSGDLNRSSNRRNSLVRVPYLTRGGKPFPASEINSSHFTVNNGSIIPESIQSDDNYLVFSHELVEENRGSAIIFHPNVFTDGYGQPNVVSSSSTSKKLFRATTRSDLLDAWWSFNRDSLWYQSG